MPVALRGRRAKRRELAAQVRLQVALDRRMAKALAPLLVRAAGQAAAGYRNAGRQGAEIALERLEREIEPPLREGMQRAFETFGRRFMAAALKARVIRIESKDAVSEFERLLMLYLAENAAAAVREISATTRRQVREAIVESEPLARGPRHVAREIVRRTGGKIARRRAATIAITETHAAAYAGHDAAQEAADLGGGNEWLATHDGRTRRTHAAADGQKRRRGEPFNIGGAAMRYPGDPRGPLRERVRCRCGLAWIDDDELRGGDG